MDTVIKRPPIDWTNVFFLVGIHVLGVLGLLYVLDGMLWQYAAPSAISWTIFLGIMMFLLCGISMTAGYHRLFTHRAYACRGAVKFFFLCFGAASVQNAVLKWAADHRRHHEFTDSARDPYTIKNGFWWAHIGWIIEKELPFDPSDPIVADLAKDRLVMFQYRWYLPLAVFFGALFPTAIAALWSDTMGGFLVGGAARLMLEYHSIFSVNSFAHTFGSQKYTTRSSARDSWWVSLITLGEGYHNYHHRFPRDFRNGVCWWQFDPGKWFVQCLELAGQAQNVIRVPNDKIAAARRAVESDTAPYTKEFRSKNYPLA